MDQNDNSQNGFLYTLLANPATGTSAYSGDLQRLVTDNPQSGLLQALLVHASDEKNLKRASAYFNPKSLYKLINNPASFNNVDGNNIYIQPALRKNSLSHAGDTFLNTESGSAQPNFNNYIGEDQSADEIDEAAPLADQFKELSPIDDTDVGEHRLDEQITADNEVTETRPKDDEQQIKPVEFHPGLENIMAFEESSSIQNEDTEGTAHVASINYSTEAIETDPLYRIEKEKEEPASVYTGIEDTGTLAGQLNNNADIPSENISQIVEATVNAEPEQTVKDSYSGPGLIDLNRFANPQQITEVQETVAEKEPVNERTEPVADIEKPVVKENLKGSDIDDDVYDEIMGIEHIQLNSTSPSPQKNEQTEPVANIDEEKNKLIVENIAATDFFMFDDAFGNHEESVPSETEIENSNETAISEQPLADEAETVKPFLPEPEVVSAGANPVKEEQQDVSKYNDDKMPYTFMWWLDKTRREHAGVSQPYAEKKEPEAIVEKKTDDVLQQQYYSNIFHITSIEELSKDEASKPFSFGVKKRSQQIIEKFIKEEPQIRPQSSDKLDNENKAKKSSEDRDEIVTETLAAIYTEQMLYYKAIAAYKKLMLKFPEKSSYFADKVEQLSKKIN